MQSLVSLDNEFQNTEIWVIPSFSIKCNILSSLPTNMLVGRLDKVFEFI